MIDHAIGPFQKIHAHTPAYLYEQGGIERRFRSETIAADEVLVVQVLLEHLYRLLIAYVQHVLQQLIHPRRSADLCSKLSSHSCSSD